MTRQEQAIENFKRKPHYSDPFEYLKQKKQEESKNEQKQYIGIS